MENLLLAMTTLCKKVESMDEEIQIIRKTASSQQHDSKNAEIRRSEVSKIPELEGDVEKHLKTHNSLLNTVAGSSIASNSSAKKKEEIKPRYTNINMNNLFSKPFRDTRSRMEELRQWVLSLLKPEQPTITRAIRTNFISPELKAMDQQEDMKAMDQQGDIKNLQKQESYGSTRRYESYGSTRRYQEPTKTGVNSIPDIFQYNTNDLSIFLSFIAIE
ncbi:uncharacterized protein [Nicotiana tomentosiformis]|uniref:uncharacterized protein n=1 Tax=Nicotiana tomentosiformis TaxID=4098 RepID=UPI00388C5EAC